MKCASLSGALATGALSSTASRVRRFGVSPPNLEADTESLYKCCDPVYPSFWFSLAERSRALALVYSVIVAMMNDVEGNHSWIYEYFLIANITTTFFTAEGSIWQHRLQWCCPRQVPRKYPLQFVHLWTYLRSLRHLSSLAKTRVDEPGPRFVVHSNDLLWFLNEPFVCVRTPFTSMDWCLSCTVKIV